MGLVCQAMNVTLQCDVGYVLVRCTSSLMNWYDVSDMSSSKSVSLYRFIISMILLVTEDAREVEGEGFYGCWLELRRVGGIEVRDVHEYNASLSSEERDSITRVGWEGVRYKGDMYLMCEMTEVIAMDIVSSGREDLYWGYNDHEGVEMYWGEKECDPGGLVLRERVWKIRRDLGNIPAARLTPNDNEARSDWWISSKAYFDGFIDQVERVPFDLSRQNMHEIPSNIYRQFVEQKNELERNKKDVDDIKEEMKKIREEMNARPVRQENTIPIIVGQHYGLSDFCEFRSMQGGPSSFMNMGKPPKFQTLMRSQPGSSDWQRQMPEQSASHYWQPSSHPVDQNIPNRGKRQQLPSKYLVTPFTVQAPTTMVPKQRVSKSKNKGKTANLSPLNLGGVFEGYNEEENNVTCGEEIMKTPDMQSLSYGTPNGWLGGEHMNSWMEFLIRRRPLNANWTVAYTSTISVHPENNQFIILNDPHVIGTLDGSTRPYPSWNDVDWVFLPIHVAGNHWATSVIDLANSHFYVFDSLAKGDVVLRQSYKPESYGKLYYACPKSKPPKHFGCGFFLERDPTSSIDEFSWSSICRTFNTPSYYSGPSTPPSYSSGPLTPRNYSQGSSRNA
ncbi:phospholipase-like protein [Tanacetum coccineum]